MTSTQPGTDPTDQFTNGDLRARILIVDDSYMVAEMLSNFLGKQGCEISYALDGSAALDMVRQHTPDLIIADWVMPTLDGLALCRQLRQSPEFAWIYYIIMTAREGNDSMDRALEAGADEFLSKPFQSAELMTRVRAGLRIVELRRQQHVKPRKLDPSRTGTPTIGTRQMLATFLPNQIAQMRSQREPLSLFVLRIANLNVLNQNLANEAKRDLMDLFSTRLTETLREGDNVFRYDEGQYVVVLTATTLAAAQLAAERCCQRMVKDPFVVQSQSPAVQIQFGTATLLETDDPQGMALLRRAAQVMRDTRNQPRATLTSPTSLMPIQAGDPTLQAQIEQLQTQNRDLRTQVAHMAQLEQENRILRKKVEELMAQLEGLQAES